MKFTFSLLIAMVFMQGCSRDFTNPYDPEVPPAAWIPKKVSISIESIQAVTLSWKHTGDFDISAIVERQMNEGEFEEIARTSATVFTDSTLIPGRTYTYRIRAAIEDRSSDPSETLTLVWKDAGTVIWEATLPGGIYSADMSPDGSFIVTGDNKGFVHLFETATGAEQWNKKVDDTGLGTSPEDLHISDDNQKIAYGVWGNDFNEVGVISASNGSRLWSAALTRQVVAVRFSHDNSKLASGGYDNRIRMWTASGGKELWNGYHSYFVEKVLFTEDDQHVYSASWDYTIKKFTVSDGTEIWTANHDGEVWDMDMSPDETRLVSGSSDKTVRMWDTASGSQLWSQATPATVMSVDYSSDGLLVAHGCTDEVKIWSAQDGSQIHTLTHPSFIHSVAFSPDASLLASCGRDGMLRVWHVDDGTLYWQSAFAEDAEFIEFTVDGRYLFCTDRSGILRFLLVNDSWHLQE
ncbi:WD40 repeat domain-containing protein [Fidelibacter multiformis]|uniref:WD40 repeat domain-containing protein n=1 Tax=Fidelibacter multiformis TaxID=3377529 RepID=UPI0037DC6D67